MHPILFEIPGVGFPIRSFGVLVAAGFLLGAWILGRLAQRYSADPEREAPLYAQIPVWAVFGVLIGARLMYVVVEAVKGSEVGRSYLEEPWRVAFIWEGGLVMYGGLFGGLLAGTWCCAKYGLSAPRAMDLGVTAGFFGLAVGRIGCLMVGDDYGRVVPPEHEGLPFPLVVHVPAELPEQSLFGVENAGRVLYATQVWMSANALLLGLAGLLLLRHRRYAGQVTLWLVLAYAVERTTIEAFRGDSVRGLWFDGAASTSQLVSAAVGALALFLLIRLRKRRDADLGPRPAPVAEG